MRKNLDNNEIYLFNTGKNSYAYRALGCHEFVEDGKSVFRFATWAPNARAVSVVGDFNGWNISQNLLSPSGTSGIWEGFVENIQKGCNYKFAILTQSGEVLLKADPFAFYSEKRPDTASIVWSVDDYIWNDDEYIKNRREKLSYSSPVSIYEVHLPSWKSDLSYRDLAHELVPYVKEMGYTHIEIMPVTEFPFDGSWGYQVTGYFSITSRMGTPQDFMYFVDTCHQNGIGVIADWVPAHFTRDAHGLRRFDGTPLYEYADTRISDQKGWGTLVFDYGRAQVQSFLISSAVFLLKECHIDALRVDAVSCMLYRDYGREDGEWIPNIYGGNQNLEAIELLKNLSVAVHRECKDAILIAEESTSFEKLTEPVENGGLGFDLKWNMGWMNDTLSYMEYDSVYRKYHHDKLTFPMFYAFSEKFVLPFSHDEVVHGKHSLIGRMVGNYDDKFKQLRLLFMYQFAQPGKKLMFMGSEFGQFIEWAYMQSLDWLLLDYEAHRNVREFVKELNFFYRSNPPLYENDRDWDGYKWVEVNDSSHSIIAFLRRDNDGNELLCVFNFTPVEHESYRLYMTEPVAVKKLISGVDLSEGKVIKSYEQDGENYINIRILPYEGAYYSITKGERPS
ncbi:MAG: 1,4-alpha-glucan branching protein GlgB [Clostridia bacterium]|nr:1,4-alpha-glucan branching protein GlgB [Clostridia bacterium]